MRFSAASSCDLLISYSVHLPLAGVFPLGFEEDTLDNALLFYYWYGP